MSQQVKCKLCEEVESVDRAPGAAGWTLLTITSKRGTKYVVACPAHTVAQVLAAVKAALEGKT